MSNYRVSDRIKNLVSQHLETTANTDFHSEEFNDIIIGVNEGILELDDSIKTAFSELKMKYSVRFPELETINLTLVEYAKIVLLIGESTSLCSVDYSSLKLPPSAMLILSMSSTSSIGKPLDISTTSQCISIAGFIVEAIDLKNKLLSFIEGQMSVIAPCLSALVGSSVAAKLIGTSGGINVLSTMPAGNILNLGSATQASKMAGGIGSLAGFSKSSSLHTGYISQCAILRSIHREDVRIRAARLVSAKCALACRYDADHLKENIALGVTSSSANYGKALREEIEKKVEKMLEPPPIQKPKPLPAPKEYAKQRRGGKRVKKQRESIAITQMRRLQNRMTFGTAAEQEIAYGDESVGLGQILSSGAESLIDGYSKLSTPKADNRAREVLLKKGREATSKFSFTSGIISSISISNGPGIQLQNPEKLSQTNTVKGILTSTSLYK